MNEDRIKIAEARGWTDVVNSDNGRWISPVGPINGLWGISPEGIGPQKLPDPFTDANDDYAVLEHFRNHKDYRQAFEKALVLSTENMGVIWRYKVGAFARAALKVISNG